MSTIFRRSGLFSWKHLCQSLGKTPRSRSANCHPLQSVNPNHLTTNVISNFWMVFRLVVVVQCQDPLVDQVKGLHNDAHVHLLFILVSAFLFLLAAEFHNPIKMWVRQQWAVWSKWTPTATTEGAWSASTAALGDFYDYPHQVPAGGLQVQPHVSEHVDSGKLSILIDELLGLFCARMVSSRLGLGWFGLVLQEVCFTTFQLTFLRFMGMVEFLLSEYWVIKCGEGWES